MSELKTQKALGVKWLQNTLGYSDVRVPNTYFVQSDGQLKERLGDLAYPLFARPCPVTPRHGFVESRVVKSDDEVLQVWKEAREADAKAEMMLMTPVDAVASAILTPTMASIGPSNDGATAGRDGTLNLKLLYVDMPRPSYLIPEGSVPYAELVYSETRAYAVQWRSGPPVDDTVTGGNYVPKDTTVQVILRSHMLSPLELEEACKQMAGQDGVVVWQAGGNPISHAAVHARLNNLPILFDRVSPQVGDKLTANAVVAVMHEDAFRNELRRPQLAELPRQLPTAYLWAMHQGPALCESEAGARFVARSAIQIWRYAATACIGEARHSRHTRNGRSRKRSVHRHEIYERALSKAPTSSYLRNTLKAAKRAFERSGEFAGGFGGKAWAGCAEASLKLYTALAECANGTGNIQNVIGAAHVVINMAHNNGTFLNKFTPSSNFDAVAGGSWLITAEALVKVYAASVALGISGTVKWPLLRDRKTHEEERKQNAALNCTVQWNVRNDGRVLHVQCGKDGSMNYKSASLPMSAIAAMDRILIRSYMADKPAQYKSFHGSNVMYWRDQLPASVLNLINLNLQETDPS